jgi:hypothetical protein
MQPNKIMINLKNNYHVHVLVKLFKHQRKIMQHKPSDLFFILDLKMLKKIQNKLKSQILMFKMHQDLNP